MKRQRNYWFQRNSTFLKTNFITTIDILVGALPITDRATYTFYATLNGLIKVL